MKSWSRFALLSLCLAPASADAEEPRSHDGGLFFRAALGGGASYTKIDNGFEEVKVKGTSGTADFALGYGVGTNLILHANVGAWVLVDPTLEFDGVESETEDLELAVQHLGAGLTYYLGDSNVFVTGFAGFGRVDAEDEGDEFDTDDGFAAGGGVGKEWWLGDHFGLGVMGSVGYHTVPERFSDDKWKGTSFAIQLTGTFN